MTSRPLRRKEPAAALMTAFAAGAGPPEKRIAARRTGPEELAEVTRSI
jgi:hypothetical protein